MRLDKKQIEVELNRESRARRNKPRPRELIIEQTHHYVDPRRQTAIDRQKAELETSFQRFVLKERIKMIAFILFLVLFFVVAVYGAIVG